MRTGSVSPHLLLFAEYCALQPSRCPAGDGEGGLKVRGQRSEVGYPGSGTPSSKVTLISYKSFLSLSPFSGQILPFPLVISGTK